MPSFALGIQMHIAQVAKVGATMRRNARAQAWPSYPTKSKGRESNRSPRLTTYNRYPLLIPPEVSVPAWAYLDVIVCRPFIIA